jgi:hypothetical protein
MFPARLNGRTLRISRSSFRTAAPARQLDHLNLLSSDVLRDRSFFQEQLDFRLSEHIVMDNGHETGAWPRVTS